MRRSLSPVGRSHCASATPSDTSLNDASQCYGRLIVPKHVVDSALATPSLGGVRRQEVSAAPPPRRRDRSLPVALSCHATILMRRVGRHGGLTTHAVCGDPWHLDVMADPLHPFSWPRAIMISK